MPPAKGWQDLDCDDLELLSCEQYVTLKCKSDNRVILLLGFWPPTDIGVDSRHGLLWEWREKQPKTLEGKTYDVLAISPTFAASPGIFPEVYFDQDYWGKGEGDDVTFAVDYRETSDKFWPLVEEYRPIAIMSFSRWRFNNQWALDAWATNWIQSAWELNILYKTRLPVVSVITETWEMPYIGGSDDDPAPPSEGHNPIAGNPPDPTKAGAPAQLTPPTPPANTRRFSNLPMNEIKAAIEAAEPAVDVAPFINNEIGPGTFVSNFLTYHVVWYREWWNTETDDDDLKCLFSGHTHVGGKVTVAEAEKAINVQLKELFKVLPATS